jgi:hypothetical protein
MPAAAAKQASNSQTPAAGGQQKIPAFSAKKGSQQQGINWINGSAAD